MALNVRYLYPFANSTCVLLPRLSFIEKNSFKPFAVSHLKQYSRCSGKYNHSTPMVYTLQKDCKKYQDSLRMKEVPTKKQVTEFNKSDRLASIKPQTEDKQLFSENENLSNKPTKEQLAHVYTVLAENLPKLFVHPLDYSIYHHNVIFEDHIRNVRTVGVYSYIKQVSFLRTVGHIKFAYVVFEILKITQHPEDSTIKIRWRIKGISTLKVMVTFWKYKLWNFKEIFDKCNSWYDGFSTFYVDGDGKVIRHVADKMMPDSDQVTEAKNIATSIKLALIVGIIPKFPELNCILG